MLKLNEMLAWTLVGCMKMLFAFCLTLLLGRVAGSAGADGGSYLTCITEFFAKAVNRLLGLLERSKG